MNWALENLEARLLIVNTFVSYQPNKSGTGFTADDSTR